MPIRCRKCGNEVKASQVMGTMDAETMLEFQKRLRDLCGGVVNPWLLELDPWFMEKAAREANARQYRCGNCGTEGDWEAGISYNPDEPGPNKQGSPGL